MLVNVSDVVGGGSGEVKQQRLWPEPSQLHGYLDRWATYVEELQHRLQVEAASHAATNQSLNSEVLQLKQLLNTVDIPYKEQIKNLEAQLEAKNMRIEYLENDVNEAISRLAHILEMSPTVKGISLQGLIGAAILLLDEAKSQFRASL